MWENAYFSTKNSKVSRSLKRALDPGRRLLALLARLRSATLATFGLGSWGPPLDQILDPHLDYQPDVPAVYEKNKPMEVGFGISLQKIQNVVRVHSQIDLCKY